MIKMNFLKTRFLVYDCYGESYSLVMILLIYAKLEHLAIKPP